MLLNRHSYPLSVHRAGALAVLLLLMLTVRGQSVVAQGIVGEAIGKLIQPAIGPIIERGIDEGFNEIIRRRPGRGVTPLPWPRPKPIPGPGPLPSPQPISPGPLPSPQPQPWPRPIPQPQPWPQPQPVPSPQPWPQPQPVPSPQPIPNPSPGRVIFPSPISGVTPAETIQPSTQIIHSRIVTSEPSAPSMSLPDNALGVPVRVQRNGFLIEHALEHVLATGPELATTAIRNEVADMRRTLTPFLSSGGSGEIAAALDGLASMSPQTPFDVRQQAITTLRDQLSTIQAGQHLTSQELAIVSQRTKNVSNMNLLVEMARVMGARRQQDLFDALDQAVLKSNAPPQLMHLLSGSAGRSDWRRLPQLTIPDGVPRLALANPSSNSADVRFVADGTEELSLPAGKLLATSQKFVVRFQTGTGAIKDYTLKQGYYQFVRGESGWDVKQKTNLRFVLSAEHSSLPFHYTLNGQSMTLPAGQSVEHLSGDVQRLDFDRGLPNRSVSTRIAMPGRYWVGVDPGNGAWEIYESPKPETMDDPTAIARQHWADSIDVALNPQSASSNGVIGSLLNAIE